MATSRFAKPPSVFQLHGKNIKEEAEKRHPNGELKFLREAQQSALTSLVGWFKNPKTQQSTAVVVMPTGAGKSAVICLLPYYLAASGPINGLDLGKPVLIIAPDLAISNQITGEVGILTDDPKQKPFLVAKKIVPENDSFVTPKVIQITLTEELNVKVAIHDEVVVTNAQKCRSDPEAIWHSLPNDFFSLVIVDEAHHLPAPQWQMIIDHFSEKAKVIFFTATPYRTDGRPITDLIELHGFAYRLTREQAILSGIIRRTEFTSVNSTEPHDLFTDVITRLGTKDRDCPLPNNNKHVAMIIVANVEKARNVETSIKDEFPQFPAAAVYHGLKSHELNRRMTAIKNGEIRIIVVVKKLLEGFDHPNVSIAAICTNIRSPVKFAQFIGRAQRVMPNEIGIVADVVTLSMYEQQKNYTSFENESLIPSTEKDVEDLENDG